jgi:hypothetical protein
VSLRVDSIIISANMFAHGSESQTFLLDTAAVHISEVNGWMEGSIGVGVVISLGTLNNVTGHLSMRGVESCDWLSAEATC